MSKIKSLIKKILVDRKALYITLALILLAAAIPTALILSSSKKADEKPAVSELTDKSSSTYSTPDSSDKVATTEALKPAVEAEPKATSEPAATADAGTVAKTASNGTSSTGTTGSSTNTQPAQPAKQTTAPTPVSYTYGNTSGNIVSGGTMASDGQYLYYSNPSDGNKLYRSRSDDSSKIKMSEIGASSINVVGDWVYYISGSLNNSGMYKVKKDGTGTAKIAEGKTSSIYVVNDWIYYVNNDSQSGEDYHLYKIKTDGSGKTKINFGTDNSLVCIEPTDLAIYEDWIFISLFKPSESTHLYRVKTDGSTAQKVLESGQRFYSVANGWIYYAGSGNVIRKAKIDGSNDQELYTFPDSKCHAYSINAAGGYIYFSSDSDSSKDIGLYKIKTDGSGFTKLLDGNAKFVEVALDWIHFEAPANSTPTYTDGVYTVTIGGSGEILKIKTDGSALSKVN